MSIQSLIPVDAVQHGLRFHCPRPGDRTAFAPLSGGRIEIYALSDGGWTPTEGIIVQDNGTQTRAHEITLGRNGEANLFVAADVYRFAIFDSDNNRIADLRVDYTSSRPFSIVPTALSGTDDTAIQFALCAVEAGGTVWFEARTYDLSKTVNVFIGTSTDPQRVTLHGNGAILRAVEGFNAGSLTAFHMTREGDVLVKDLHPIIHLHRKHVSIENLTVRGLGPTNETRTICICPYGLGHLNHECSYSDITGCFIQDAHIGIALSGFNNAIRNTSVAWSKGINGSSIGILLVGARMVTIDTCAILYNGRGLYVHNMAYKNVVWNFNEEMHRYEAGPGQYETEILYSSHVAAVSSTFEGNQTAQAKVQALGARFERCWFETHNRADLPFSDGSRQYYVIKFEPHNPAARSQYHVIEQCLFVAGPNDVHDLIEIEGVNNITARENGLGDQQHVKTVYYHSNADRDTLVFGSPWRLSNTRGS